MLPRFRYLRPASLDEVLNLLDRYGPEARVMAGGTDILVGMADGSVSARYLIDLKAVTDLSAIRTEDGLLRIGACVTVNQLLEFGGLPPACRAIHQAAGRLATYQIRNRATVGGNLCNASPACDLAPPLLALGARLRAASADGERFIPLRDFFRGVKSTCCRPAEVVAEILVPLDECEASAFAKRTRIRGHDLALVNGAAVRLHGDRLRIALGAVAETPVCLEDLGGSDGAGADRQSIIDTVLASISPIDDVRGSAEYRTAMAAFIVGDILDRLGRPSGG